MNTYLITFINGTNDIVDCDSIIPDRMNDGRFLNAILNGKVFRTYYAANILSIDLMNI